MSWLDAGLLALRNLGRRGVRTILTGIAVALGTTLLVALLAVAASADTRIVSQLSKGGPATAIHVDDALPAATQLQSDTLQSGEHHPIDDGALRAIRGAPHVTSVVPVLSMPALAVPCPPAEATRETDRLTAACLKQPRPYGATMVGTDLTMVPDLPITVLAGRLPRPGSLTEVAATPSYFDKLGISPTQASAVVGTEIEFAQPQLVAAPASASGSNDRERFRGRWYRALIVGVVAQEVEGGDFLVPIQQTRAARRWALAGAPDPNDRLRADTAYSALVVVADNLSDIHTVRAEITDLGYATAAPEHLVASVQKYLHVVDIVLGGIGLIALTIATLGVANSLLAAVRERWREIGVVKALGATDADVLRWFLFEAGVLGLVGGLVGTAAGVGVAFAVGEAANNYLIGQGLPGVDLVTVPVTLVVTAPLGATALAMLAGALPALGAARLPAREALGSL